MVSDDLKLWNIRLFNCMAKQRNDFRDALERIVALGEDNEVVRYSASELLLIAKTVLAAYPLSAEVQDAIDIERDAARKRAEQS